MTDLPTHVIAGVTPGWETLRIVDVSSGGELKHVIEANAEAGRVTRLTVDEDGNLVREGDAFAMVKEECAIRIELAVLDLAHADAEPPATPSPGEPSVEANA